MRDRCSPRRSGRWRLHRCQTEPQWRQITTRFHHDTSISNAPETSCPARISSTVGARHPPPSPPDGRGASQAAQSGAVIRRSALLVAVRKQGTRTVRHSPRVVGAYSYLGVVDLQVCGLMVSSTRGRTAGAQSGERRGRRARRLSWLARVRYGQVFTEMASRGLLASSGSPGAGRADSSSQQEVLESTQRSDRLRLGSMTGRFLGPRRSPRSTSGEQPRSARKDTNQGRTVHPRRHKRVRRGRRGSSQLAGADPRRGRGDRCVSGTASGRAW